MGYAAPWAYPQHIPVIGPNGVPVDTPEVQHARAAHLAAHAEANARGGGYAHGVFGHGAYGPVAYAGHAYEIPRIGPNGVPLDTAEVAHAKAAHFAAHAEASARSAHAGWHYRRRRSIYASPWAYAQHIPVIGPNGVPVDTPEVQHAKAAHFAAHAAAGGHAGHLVAGPIVAYGAAPLTTVITHNGLPLDTPEVQHAKAAHFAAYNSAAVRNSVGPSGHVPINTYAAPWAHGIAAVSHNGVPLDTPEVAVAKAAHLAAHAAARAHHY